MIAKTLLKLLLFGLVLKSVLAFEIYHTPPEHYLQGVPGQLEVLPPHYLDPPDYVKLFVRRNDQDFYQVLDFYEQEGSWFCDIPAAFMNTDTLCYYITASFGPAGFAASPQEQPEMLPYKVPLIKFDVKGKRFEPKLVQDVIAEFSVTPWQPKPAYRSNNFPVLYIPKTNSAFIESGYIKIVGNEKASVEDLLTSMLYLCLQENADAITEVRYSLLTAKPEMTKLRGHVELVGVYLRRIPQN